MSTKSSHLAARLLLAIVLLAAMLDCQGTVQYRYCTGACVPAPAYKAVRPCVFLPRVLYRFAPQLQTREKHKATQVGRLPGCTQGCPESGDCPS